MQVDWALAGANALGSLFGGIGAVKAQKLANEANIKMTQMNNDAQVALWREQRDYNTEMWNKQNEYNSAFAQRRRLEDAGLNPYLMLSGGDAGSASSFSHQGLPNTQAPQVESGAGLIQETTKNIVDSIGSVAQLGIAFAQQRKANEEAKALAIQNEYLRDEIELRLNRGKLQYNIDDSTANEVIKQRQLETDIMSLQKQGQDLENQAKKAGIDYQNLVNFWYNHRQATEIQLIDEQMKSYQVGRELTYAQVHQIVEQTVLTKEQRKKLEFENKATKKFFDNYVSYMTNYYLYLSDYYGGFLNLGNGLSQSKGSSKFVQDYNKGQRDLNGPSSYGVLAPFTQVWNTDLPKAVQWFKDIFN